MPRRTTAAPGGRRRTGQDPAARRDDRAAPTGGPRARRRPVRLPGHGTDVARQHPDPRHHRRRGGVRSPTPSRPPACCRRRRTNGCATSSPRRCRAGSAASPTCGPRCACSTPRSAPSPPSPTCPAGSGSASTTAAATCPDSAPTSACTLSTTTVAVLLAGVDTGVRIAPPDVVATLIVDRETIRRDPRKALGASAELDDVAPLTRWPCADRPSRAGPGRPSRGRRSAGSTQDDGRVALGAAVPLGVLQARVAEYPGGRRRADGDHAVAFGARLRPRRGRRRHRAAGARTAGPGLRRRAHRGSTSARAPAAPAASTPPPTSARDAAARRRGRRRLFTGTSSGANVPAAAHPTARCWSPPQTDTCAHSHP